MSFNLSVPDCHSWQRQRLAEKCLWKIIHIGCTAPERDVYSISQIWKVVLGLSFPKTSWQVSGFLPRKCSTIFCDLTSMHRMIAPQVDSHLFCLWDSGDLRQVWASNDWRTFTILDYNLKWARSTGITGFYLCFSW